MGGLFSKPTLFDAANTDDVEMAKRCVENGADVNAEDKHGKTPLIIAVNKKHSAILQFLLENGADVDGKTAGNDTALIRAVELKNETIVNILLDHGANLNIQVRLEATTALIRAAEIGYFPIAKALVAKGALLEAVNCYERTALMQAAEKRCDDVVMCLIENKARVDAQDNRRMTALILAAKQGRRQSVDYLLEHGASVDIEDFMKRTALMTASLEGHVEIIQALLMKGAKVDTRDGSGCTALMLVVTEGSKRQMEVMTALKRFGADASLADHAGNTVLIQLVQKLVKDEEVLRRDRKKDLSALDTKLRAEEEAFRERSTTNETQQTMLRGLLNKSRTELQGNGLRATQARDRLRAIREELNDLKATSRRYTQEHKENRRMFKEARDEINRVWDLRITDMDIEIMAAFQHNASRHHIERLRADRETHVSDRASEIDRLQTEIDAEKKWFWTVNQEIRESEATLKEERSPLTKFLRGYDCINNLAQNIPGRLENLKQELIELREEHETMKGSLNQEQSTKAARHAKALKDKKSASISVLKFLLKIGAPAAHANKAGDTAESLASKHGYKDLYKILRDSKPIQATPGTGASS